jgi:hypothetical protein
LKTFSRTRKLKLIDGFAADPHEKYS